MLYLLVVEWLFHCSVLAVCVYNMLDTVSDNG
jgi:hypothetical protein